MKKKGHTPITRVKNPEPHISDPDWIIWAAWADRITFEEIEKKITSKTKAIVICNPGNPTGYLYSQEELEFINKPI